jgi:chromate transporter
MTDPTGRRRPASLAELFVVLTLMALQGFGGVLAVVQRELVERRQWLTREEFIEEWAVAQIMPGPNVINLGLMLGHRYFGLRGAAVAVAGLIAAPLALVLVLAGLYSSGGDNPQVAGALRGMGAVAAGLITATGIKLATALKTHPAGKGLVIAAGAATFIGIVVLRWPLAWMLLLVGGVSCWITWTRLGARE